MRSLKTNYFAASVIFLCGGATARVEAGRPLPEEPTTYGRLDGILTLELGFSADEIAGRANLIAPLYKDPNGKTVFSLVGNWLGNSGSNENASAGLLFRHRFEDPDIIIGFNGFYDYGEYSGRGYNQGGAGFEMLSKWIDFRANGYFTSYSVRAFGRYSNGDASRFSSSYTASKTVFFDGGEFSGNGDTQETTRNTTTHVTKHRVSRGFERHEGVMPGFDLELGGLIPYLDRWAETRIYGGYAFFHDPFGHDVSCFTARLESRPVPALVLDVEYKGDSRLVDGENHWFFAAKVEIPFDLGNLLVGKSPFAGITEAFTPTWMAGGSAGPSGEGKDKKVIQPLNVERNRMNEEIIRNWRPAVTRTGQQELFRDAVVKQCVFVDERTIGDRP